MVGWWGGGVVGWWGLRMRVLYEMTHRVLCAIDRVRVYDQVVVRTGTEYRRTRRLRDVIVTDIVDLKYYS